MSYRDKNEKLNAEAVAIDVEAQDPAMEVCLRCGQTFDTRVAEQVDHHLQPTHVPLSQQNAEVQSDASGPSSAGDEGRSGFGEGTFDQDKVSNRTDIGIDGC